MRNFWEKIGNIGSHPSDTEEELKQIRLINHLTFLVFIVNLGYVPLMMTIGFITQAWIMLVVSLVFPVGYIFSSLRYFRAAAVLLFLLVMGNVSFTAVVCGDIAGEYLLLPVGIVGFIAMKSMRESLVLYIVNLLCFVAVLVLKQQVEPWYEVPEENRTFLYYTDLVMTFVASAMAMVNFKSVLGRYERTTLTQRKQIEVRNKEILDSIQYAKRIQYTLLANREILERHLPEHFILFRPKDVVSGDFYWAASVEDRFYLAICDSTGHGVPGAFMSLLNISFLNEAVNERRIREPDAILNYVRVRLKEALKGENTEESRKDGMDGVLLCFSEGKKELSFACAQSPMILIRKGAVTRFPADRMPVGTSPLDTVPFTRQSMTPQAGDMIYLFTDGYADQFGGEKGKKYRVKNLLERLTHLTDKPMEEQRRLLEEDIERWRGDLDQVDDICVAGIRL